jgi:hypothetical protein
MDWITPIGPDGAFLVGGSVPIETAHRTAMPHKGIWLHILSADAQLLLVRRAASMVPCGGQLAIIGEHHQGRESDDACAVRGLKAELPGLASLRRSGRLRLFPLLPEPRWFLFDCAPRHVHHHTLPASLLPSPCRHPPLLLLITANRNVWVWTNLPVYPCLHCACA